MHVPVYGLGIECILCCTKMARTSSARRRFGFLSILNDGHRKSIHFQYPSGARFHVFVDVSRAISAWLYAHSKRGINGKIDRFSRCATNENLYGGMRKSLFGLQSAHEHVRDC